MNLLSKAAIVWNTVYLRAAPDAFRHKGYPVHEVALAHRGLLLGAREA
jgi:hypothetical protein